MSTSGSSIQEVHFLQGESEASGSVFTHAWGSKIVDAKNERAGAGQRLKNNLSVLQWMPRQNAGAGQPLKNDFIEQLAQTTAMRELRTPRQKAGHTSASQRLKNDFIEPLAQATDMRQEKRQQMAESGSEGQNMSVDVIEGSEEFNPIAGEADSQTGHQAGHIRATSNLAYSCEWMEGNENNPPTLESASDKCVYNNEISAYHSFLGTHSLEMGVHSLVRCRRHSDTTASIRKIISQDEEVLSDQAYSVDSERQADDCDHYDDIDVERDVVPTVDSHVNEQDVKPVENNETLTDNTSVVEML
ncbi:hypothetical protein SCA6_018008 [Theobroma cacao]